MKSETPHRLNAFPESCVAEQESYVYGAFHGFDAKLSRDAHMNCASFRVVRESRTARPQLSRVDQVRR